MTASFFISPRLKAQVKVSLAGLASGFAMLTATLPAIAYCRADLPERIDAIAANPALQSARLGLLVEIQAQNADQRRVIYARDQDRYFLPASTLKLLTTAAALQQLGPDFRIRTSIYGTEAAGIASLYVVGRGDPTFTTAELDELIQQLQQRGIQRVSNLTGIDTYFPGRTVNAHWEWEDVQAGYGAPVNSLILNQNELGLTVFPQQIGQPLRVEWDNPQRAGRWQIDNYSLTVGAGEPEFVDIGRDIGQPLLKVYGHLIAGAEPETTTIAITNPGAYFLQQFQQQLQRQNIAAVSGVLSPLSLPADVTELAAVESPPLSDWLTQINQLSVNLHAEALLKSLGLATAETPPDDATEAGIAAVKAILEPMGIAPESFVMVDGSGLSRHNLTTPQALVDTLQAMAYAPEAERYRRSLAIAGVNGTLRNRFRGTMVEGQLQGKTGLVSGNYSLVGYLNPPQHPPVVFSLFVNNAAQSGRAIRALMDEMVLEIAQLNDC